jgi:hypothetical protein
MGSAEALASLPARAEKLFLGVLTADAVKGG